MHQNKLCTYYNDTRIIIYIKHSNFIYMKHSNFIVRINNQYKLNGRLYK